ncbi:hypothetical protein JCGZ_03896 [Jatropha curcas]|uniref:Aminotransferase-like plant mobile domain-containing protein n=1 Tax=Jatropha curcas TaxID=180498 RepID=A0A067LI62_JATCU|nr:hypothetical protein JCGZ_03896 [Jatropha curcas]
METLGALPGIPTFDGESVPVSRNPLTSGIRPLQLLPLPGTEFPLRYETSQMRSFQAEVDLGKARSGGSATDESAFWDLLDPPMRARVIAAGFGDYAEGIRRTQPRFPPAMRYALMERWNDCTHTFVFGFGEMTLTPVDYAAITGLRFTGLVPPLDARGEDPEYWRSFLNDRELSDDLSGPRDGRAANPIEVPEQGYWADRYFLGERVYDTPVAPVQRRVPHSTPRHMCLLEGLTREDLEVEYRGFSANDFLSAGDFPAYFSSRMQARLPEILECTQERKTHKTAAHYRAEVVTEAGAAVAPARPARIIPGDVPFPPGMEVPTQRYLEVCQRFGFARSYIAQLYSERHERDLEIGRLQRHQSRQSSVVSRLQVEVDRLRTRLEVEGIPLDEDDDGSSDDAPPSPPPQMVVGPSRRRR